MRNIVVHQIVRGLGSGDVVERVLVRGIAFGLTRLQISLRGKGTRALQVVQAASDGSWHAWFDASNGLVAAQCACGGLVKAEAADASDPEGCYSSIETQLVCDPVRG